MTTVQTTTTETGSVFSSGNNNTAQELASAIGAIQSIIQHGEGTPPESLVSILPVLQQARQVILESQKQVTQPQGNQEISAEFNPLQTLLDILPVGIVIVRDVHWRAMAVNQAGLRLLELHPETNGIISPVDEATFPFKFLVGGNILALQQWPIILAITENMSQRDVEMDVRFPNGKVKNLIVYSSPLYDESGRVSGSLGVMVDITARKSAEQRLFMQYTIAHILAESYTINKAAPQVMQLICETAHWEYGALWQVEPDMSALTNKGVWYSQGKNLSEYAEVARYSTLTAEEDSLPGMALKGGQPVWLPNLAELSSAYVEEARERNLRSAYLLPVKNGTKVLAVIECLSDHDQVQDAHIAEMLNAVGNQVRIFLERKVLEETLAVRANQQHLLAEAGMALATSVDLERRLRNIAHLVVPEMADWCAIDTIDTNKVLRRIAVAHVDASKENLLFEIQPTREINFDVINTPQIQTLLTGQPKIYSDLPFSVIEESITDPHQLEILRQLNPVSSIVAPLIAHDQILGVFTFVQSDSGRRYTPGDLALAEDIVQRTALAVDNALLYTEAQKLNSELEQRVDKRTVQLKVAVDELREQIIERQSVEEEIRIINADLEQRILQRTSQLETANRDLQMELENRKKTSEALKVSLKRTQELYRISQTIGIVRSPDEVLTLLLSSGYLKPVSRASIAILDRTWMREGPAPENCFILTEWNKGKTLPTFKGRDFSLEEYGVKLPVPYGQPILIMDIQCVMELPERVRKRFADLKTHSLIILPLIAGGEWYGLLSLHFKNQRVTNLDDLRHVRGLVDEAAIVIKNMRLLEAESQARQEAERANALKLKFLGMISHELRTPLASIKGFATTLLAEDVDWPAEKQRDFIETINQESDKLHDLIEQLLDLSRMEAGVLRISPAEVSLGRIIESARPQLSALTTEHALKLKIPPQLPLIMADQQRIAQVITNLVNNAAKFSAPGTPIHISARQSGKQIQVDVADEGPGIPMADRQRVFTAFRQLENSGGHSKGAGLGLAICKGLIEAHNGRIWIQERKGPGTVMSFTLPTIDI